jgi:hypothetical protein
VNFKQLISLLFSCCLFQGCSISNGRYVSAGVGSPGGQSYENYYFKSISPLPAKSFIKDKNGVREEIHFEDMDTAAIRDYLGQSLWVSTIEKIESGSSVGISDLGITGEKGFYRIVLDNVSFETENVEGSNSYVRVGVGVRISADVETKKANLKIPDIQSLLIAHKRNAVKGSVKVEKIGVISNKLALLSPPSGELSENLLKRTEEYAVTVNSLIGDDNTRLKPYVIAVSIPADQSIVRPPVDKSRSWRFWPFGRR